MLSRRQGLRFLPRSFVSFSTKAGGNAGLSQFGGVHGSAGGGRAGSAKLWRNKPLLRRDGDKIFRVGAEATQLLISEALRKDSDSLEFISSWESVNTSLNVVYDRMPKYAWIMKQMLEPERTIVFRVAWIDDSGISRVNRGYRVQYSSALGPYVGGTSFTPRVNWSTMKAAAFDTTFTNALSNQAIGGAFGGADFNPYDKSETEIQRFCQSYMTELSKYIGPDVDLPGLGDGCGSSEIGYLYGQYKRVNQHCGQVGRGLLWGGSPVYQQAQGYGVVHFAQRALHEKGQSLEGKKCLITGSQSTAMAVAEKLIEYGAIPITFTDSSGHIYEPGGFDVAKLKTIQRIKDERGARVGRYIIASTSAKFNEFGSVFDIPCDIAFPCSSIMQVSGANVQTLADNGCKAIIEGVQQAMSNGAIVNAKKRGIFHGPYRATTVGASMVNGMSVSLDPISPSKGETLDSRVKAGVNSVYDEIKSTANEFNTRGDLHSGANIAAFLRVANVMLAHGST